VNAGEDISPPRHQGTKERQGKGTDLTEANKGNEGKRPSNPSLTLLPSVKDLLRLFLVPWW
jgi:hypothetical protein